MTAPSNAELQTSIITKLKATAAITSQLDSGAVEIREDQWQGTEFDYPNIRVRMIRNEPNGDTAGCSSCIFEVSIMVFSQSYSSLEADTITGIINASLNLKSFMANGLLITLRTTNMIPAVRYNSKTMGTSSDIRTWRAECLMEGLANKTS